MIRGNIDNILHYGERLDDQLETYFKYKAQGNKDDVTMESLDDIGQNDVQIPYQ